MRHYKIINNSFVEAIGIGFDGLEITVEEYNGISDMIDNRPTPPEGYDYRLREDLTWELYELPPIDPVDDEIDDSEALAIILGGEA